MSLINDALKRAKEKQNTNPPPDLEFQQEDDPRQPANRLVAILTVSAITFIFVGALAILGAVAFLRQNSRLQVSARTAPPLPEKTASQPPPTPVVQNQTTTSAPDFEKPVAKEEESPRTPKPTLPGENDTNSLPVATQPAEPPPAPTATVAVEPPKPAGPKLQGIFFNPARPSAVVSGRTVFVGSIVGGSRVTEITQECVTLISETATNCLSLSE